MGFHRGEFFWLGIYISDSTFLGFGTPWTWLMASHFAFAGFGFLTITSLSCRVESNVLSLQILRLLLFLHPVAYLFTAAGIQRERFWDEIGSTLYGIIFLIQCVSVVLGNPDRISRFPRTLLIISLSVPLLTMIPALAWAWNHPIFDLSGMIRYHGLANAFGHVGLGFIAFALSRPSSHASCLSEARCED